MQRLKESMILRDEAFISLQILIKKMKECILTGLISTNTYREHLGRCRTTYVAAVSEKRML